MKSTKKATCALRRVLLLILILSLALTGCGWGDAGIDTFTSPSGWYSVRADAKSPTSIFDINDVTLTFYFGQSMSPSLEHQLENSTNLGCAYLYFENDDGDRSFIRKTEDPITSETHRAWYNYDGIWTYRHSEVLTIPAELFNKQIGEVRFEVAAVDNRSENKEPGVHTRVRLFYRKTNDGKVEINTTMPFEQ